MPAGPCQQVSVTPELRRALGLNRAPQAFGLLTRTAVKLPEHMSRADEPVLVGRVQFYDATLVRLDSQYLRPKQRDIVEMHNVEALVVEHLAYACLFQERPSALLREQWRKPLV